MPTSTRTCPDCHAELADSNRFCPSCGARTPQYTAAAGQQPATEAQTSEAQHRARLQRALGAGWQITRLIGRGGFAEVYGAMDVSLHREVAVKTLRHDLELSPQMLQRFRREAESVARLRHPNIVPIYQVGEGEGIVYFIMPLIEGESLATALVRDGSFSIAETCRVLREVAGALGAAHRMGVVHRDVKPDNIMLEGPERRAVVMDFGIAKVADAAEARLTGTGLLIGSPHYMSPEQAAGESQLDQRSDEYSLAVVGYQMLAGRMPFESTSVQSILFKQMTEVPPPITELRPDVPPALAAALARALSKKAEDRFQTIEEFAAAIPGEYGRRGGESVRKMLDMRARVEIARGVVQRWRWIALAALVVGIVGTWAAFRAIEPAPALAVAAMQGEATFTAKTAVPALRNADLWTDMAHDDSVYRFIYSATRSRRATDSIARAVNVWRWVVQTSDRGPRVPFAEVGLGGHVVAQGTTWADSVQRPAVSGDSARVLATAVLRQHGWAPARLSFAGDSVRTVGERTDHMLRWTVPGAVAVGPTGSAIRQIRVTVRGDSVGSYREAVLLPKRKSVTSLPVFKAVMIGVVTLMCCALAILAFVMVVRRSRVDDLQWKPFVVLMAAIGIPSVVVTAVAAVHSDHQVSSGFLISFILGLLGAVALIPAAVAESVFSEHEPRVVTGITDLSRGKLLIPELMTAALVGYPAALCLSALNGVILIAAQVFGAHAAIGDGGAIVAQPVAALTPFISLSTSWCAMIGIAFGVALVLTRRWPRWIGIALPAAVMLMFALLSSNSGIGDAVPVVDALVLAAILWRFGFWSAVVTMMLVLSLEGAITLFVAGGQAGMGTAIIAAALLCVPAALGAGAWHRIRTGELR